MFSRRMSGVLQHAVPCMPPSCPGPVYEGMCQKIISFCSSQSPPLQLYTVFIFIFFTVECGSQIHFVNSASKRLIKSVEESKCAVAQQAPKAFWVGVWKCIRHPPTCFSVCMYSCSFTPRLSLSSVSHTQTSAWHIHTGISHFASHTPSL